MKKDFSHLSVKMVISFSLVVIVMSSLLGYLFFTQIKTSLRDGLENQLMTAAKAAALLIDVDTHEALRTDKDMDKDAYKEQKAKLQKLREETGLAFIYTFRKSNEQLSFVLDTGEGDDGSNIGEVYEEPLSALPAMQKAFEGIPAADGEFYTDEYGTFLSGYAPLRNANSEVVAIVGTDIDAAKVVTIENQAKWALIIVITLFIAVVVAVSSIFARKITRPLNTVTEKMMETARMGGDLTQRIAITSHDEIGLLSSAFNQLFDTIHDIMIKVKETTLQMSHSSTELSTAMEQGTQEINQIAYQSNILESGINDVSGLFERAKGEIDILSASSQEVAASSQEVDGAAQIMKVSAQTASSALGDSAASISQLASLTENANNGISELDAYTQSIGNIVDTINGIAKNTNLLALNAMIEAQRAGEAGRGFAVVAENIRVLSANTQNSVSEIRNLVNAVIDRIYHIVEIQKAIDPAVKKTITASETAENLLQQIVAQSQNVANLISQISNVNESQAVGVEKLAAFMYEINQHFSSQIETSRTTTAATQELTATSEMILDNANTLASISTELKSLINNFKL